MPQQAAGRRTEPPVSEPSAPNAILPPTAAPEPLEEPPGMWAGFHGLRQSPQCSLWPVGPVANSAILSPPSVMAPASWSRARAVLSWSGTKSRRIREPQVETRPARKKMSLCAIGTPCSGPGASPRASAASAAAASSRRGPGFERDEAVEHRLQDFRPRKRGFHHLERGKLPRDERVRQGAEAHRVDVGAHADVL